MCLKGPTPVSFTKKMNPSLHHSALYKCGFNNMIIKWDSQAIWIWLFWKCYYKCFRWQSHSVDKVENNVLKWSNSSVFRTLYFFHESNHLFCNIISQTKIQNPSLHHSALYKCGFNYMIIKWDSQAIWIWLFQKI